MSEIYDATYAAIRSKVQNGDIGSAVERVLCDQNIGHQFTIALQCLSEFDRPSVLYRPKLFIDGDKYCALYGEDLMGGIAGFGDTAEAAMRDFDTNWHQQTLSQEDDDPTPCCYEHQHGGLSTTEPCPTRAKND